MEREVRGFCRSACVLRAVLAVSWVISITVAATWRRGAGIRVLLVAASALAASLLGAADSRDMPIALAVETATDVVVGSRYAVMTKVSKAPLANDVICFFSWHTELSHRLGAPLGWQYDEILDSRMMALKLLLHVFRVSFFIDVECDEPSLVAVCCAGIVESLDCGVLPEAARRPVLKQLRTRNLGCSFN